MKSRLLKEKGNKRGADCSHTTDPVLLILFY
jgi:hypothetical protein